MSHLSVITACVPTMKPLFDSLLGNTMSLKIDGLYELSQRSNGQSGFKVTEHGDTIQTSLATDQSRANTAYSARSSETRHVQRLHSHDRLRPRESTSAGGRRVMDNARLKLGSSPRSFSDQTTCSIPGQAGEKRRDRKITNTVDIHDMERTESVKGLMDGIITTRDDDEVQLREYDDSSLVTHNSSGTKMR